MAYTTDFRKWTKDRSKWEANQRKYKKSNLSLSKALKKIDKLLKEHGSEIGALEKRVKARGNHYRAGAIVSKLKRAHFKQNLHHALHSKARNNILKITKSIENAVKRFNIA